MNVTIFPSAQRGVATYNSPPVATLGKKGIRVFLEITERTSTSTLNVKLQVYDPIAGQWHDLTGASFAAKSATGRDYLTIYPGLGAVANAAVDQVVTSPIRAVAVVGSAGVMTFSVSGTLID